MRGVGGDRPCPRARRRGRTAPAAGRAYVGCGRIAASEIEAPKMFVDLVYMIKWVVAQSDNTIEP